MAHQHEYEARVTWDGNLGEGTSGYANYGRQFHAAIAGKPDLTGSADPAFRGDPAQLNPEDLFLTSIAACHMLSYLALCARNGVRTVSYDDRATGLMVVDPATGGGRFKEIVLHPSVTVATGSDVALAMSLHERAHELCFIANSCRVPIRHEATVDIESHEARPKNLVPRVPKDLAIELEHRPGALAEMGEVLGRAGVSIDGGGVFASGGVGVAHFLFHDPDGARKALQEAGIRVVGDNEVLVQRLNQDEPGQLGKIARAMASAGVNIEVQYSDHDHQLILVVDDIERGKEVSRAWNRKRVARG